MYMNMLLVLRRENIFCEVWLKLAQWNFKQISEEDAWQTLSDHNSSPFALSTQVSK